jgi:hypothetical protein
MKTINRNSINPWNTSRRCSNDLTESISNFLVPQIFSENYKSPLGEIKAEIESQILFGKKWRHCGVQLAMDFSVSNESLLEKIFRLRKTLILLEVYNLIFKKRYPHQIVFDCLSELIAKYHLQNDFVPVTDSLSMVICSVYEHQRIFEQTISSELLLSITKPS